MSDLIGLFDQLVGAASMGRFEEALMGTPIAGAHLHGHPLGFRVVRISDGPLSLRLHLWKGPACEQPGFEIHDHAFDLTSYVVAGVVRQRTYSAVRAMDGQHAVYRVTYDDGRSALAHSGCRVRVEAVGDERFAQGETYSLPAGQLHEAYRDNCDTAITLVLTTAKTVSPVTIGPWDGEVQLNAPRLRLDDRTLGELGLSKALAL